MFQSRQHLTVAHHTLTIQRQNNQRFESITQSNNISLCDCFAIQKSKSLSKIAKLSILEITWC